MLLLIDFLKIILKFYFLNLQVQAVDKDIGENGDIRYELVRGSGELFRVDRRTGEILLRQTLEGQQHHSSTSDYELLVAAYDGGSPPLSSEALVRIKVVDKNQPVFGLQYYSAVVSENAESLSPVLSVQASSPSGRQLIYSIVSGNEGEEFAVDFNTGRWLINHPLLSISVGETLGCYMSLRDFFFFFSILYIFFHSGLKRITQ